MGCGNPASFSQLLKSINYIQILHAVCFTDYNHVSKMNIFKSILTTFIMSDILEAAVVITKIGSGLESNHLKQI